MLRSSANHNLFLSANPDFSKAYEPGTGRKQSIILNVNTDDANISGSFVPEYFAS